MRQAKILLRRLLLPLILKTRLGVSIAILSATSLVIFVTIAMMFARLDERQEGIEASIRESVLWAAFQSDREAGRFVEAIVLARLAPSDASFAELALRYDVLYSRAAILDQAILAAQLGPEAVVPHVGGRAHAAILALAPRIDALMASPAELYVALPELLDGATAIRKATEALTLEANAANNAARVEDRDEMQKTYRAIAGGVLVLTLALVIVVTLLVVQLFHVSRAGRRLRVLTERSVREAAAANAGARAMSAFLATISHEIRTPLNGIIGMAEVMAVSDLAPDQADKLAIIRQSGDHLLGLINDVLDYSKLEAGAVRPDPADFPLRDLIESVRAIIAPRAAAKGLGLSVEAPDIEVTSDAALLRQILLNLVGNAIKFTAEGAVRVSARPLDGGRIRVEVEDTGVGIAPDAIPRLFMEFSQVDASSTRRYGGTGLGLAISRRLVAELGGVIDVESTPGRGSLFWFETPSGPLRAAAPRAAVEAPRPAARSFAGRILVVEDNAVNRQVACGLLSGAGLEVDCAADGAVALSMTDGAVYDVVLMDMQMPVLDGVSATRAMRARGYAGPIVGLTANAFLSDRAACLAAGMDDFMAKPVTWAKLGDILTTWLPPDAARGPAPVAADLDVGHRAALIEELGADLVGSLVRDFAQDSLRLLETARRARASGDADTVDRCLHTIKGAGQTLGFVEIGRVAQMARDAGAGEAVFERLEALVRAAALTDPERFVA